ncbi:hypothetical protein NWE55_01610 [Myroides albus]|uniref:Addiction module component n=1 Tax=Myroides albus TaxID=2562892 RepID=A0A6I3LN60_9FLAO|nr:hypothetical protein [Myroides albus]MTG98926.1 hypothetical protein [Myroides albus]UVD80015.1 hypothetical protein NWE55_01610 [Myroides albus]
MSTHKLQNDKLDLIHWINELDDYTVIARLKSMMNTIQKEDLSFAQKKAIDEALVSIDTEVLESHDTVMEQTKLKFPHLFQK